MSRTLFRPSALAIMLLAAGLSFQPAAAQVPPAAGPAPAATVHSGIKLAFPPNVGGATLERTEAIGPSSAAYQYLTANRMLISVYALEPGGGRRVPPGAESSQLMAQFAEDMNQTIGQAKASGFQQVERPSVPSLCPYGSTSFRCLVYSAAGTNGRLYSKVLMTGYNGYFLKIRIDWAQSSKQTQADADQALQSFVPALLH